jgi:drug/metabolite transporter (DMT)-like permease
MDMISSPIVKNSMVVYSYVLIAYWGLFSGLGYVLFYYCLVKLEVAKATAFFYLSPLFAVALSIAILGEALALPFVIGIAAILFGIWATQSNSLGPIRFLRRRLR